MPNPSEKREPAAILIAEDEPLTAWMLADEVGAMGLSVLGPFPSTGEALEAMEKTMPQAALLDVNLSDGEVFALSDALDQKSIPLIFHTVYSQKKALESRYPEAKVLSKPADAQQIRNAIRSVMRE